MMNFKPYHTVMFGIRMYICRKHRNGQLLLCDSAGAVLVDHRMLAGHTSELLNMLMKIKTIFN